MMSDSSSDDEDLSRFREAVDNSFMKNLKSNNQVEDQPKEKPKSERYLEEASHYNDVKVPAEMQKKIGAKLSAIIDKKIKFVEVESDLNKDKPVEVQGGVKLFSNSDRFLSCEDAKDTYTETHNMASKKLSKKRRKIEGDNEVPDDKKKLEAAAISGEYILSKEETKLWKSRRKEKVFKYKSHSKSKVLTAIE